MTHQDNLKTIASRTGLTQKNVGAVVNALLEVATETLAKGDDFIIPKFCKLKRKIIKGRKIKAGFKGMDYETKDHFGVKITAFDKLKKSLNN